jgi:AcrR family transcriptional regulator/DNA-binding MarR family transcriptional regulator
VARRVRGQPGVVAEFQRSRLLVAALREASERGSEGTSVASIIARAGVSRKTFYELFPCREDCFTAVFEESVARVGRVVVPVYERDGTWSERVRGALGALLEFLEDERELGVFMLARITGHGAVGREFRGVLLAGLQDVVEAGRSRAKANYDPPPLTAECVVGAVLAVLQAQLRRRERGELRGLVNPLMWTIVLPYLGPVAAAAELRRPLAERAVRPAAPRPLRSARDVLAGLDMRVTYRTARVLAVIAEEPGVSNVEIASRVGVVDQGQISKLLTRLARLKLVRNTGAGQARGAANAWSLTRKGVEVDAAIRREFAFDGPAGGSR